MATGVSGQPYSRLSQPVETLEGNAPVREAATLSSAPSQEPPEPVSGPAAPPALGTSSAASTPSSAASTPSPTGKMRWKSIKRTSTGLLAAVRATSAFAEASARAKEAAALAEAERTHYLDTLHALKLIQRAMRRKKWRWLLTAALNREIPVLLGPCGAKAWPICRGSKRIGIEGASRKHYRGTTLGFLTPDHPWREAVVFLVEMKSFGSLSLVRPRGGNLSSHILLPRACSTLSLR